MGLKYMYDRQTSTTKASFLAFHHLQYGISGLVDCYQLKGKVLFPLTCGIASSVSQIFHVHAAALSESRVWPLLLKTIGMQQSVIRLLATSSIGLGTQESASQPSVMAQNIIYFPEQVGFTVLSSSTFVVCFSSKTEYSLASFPGLAQLSVTCSMEKLIITSGLVNWAGGLIPTYTKSALPTHLWECIES